MYVLEINVDDVGLGGVYSLVNSVIRNRPDNLKIDIACIAEFENQDNISALRRLGAEVYYIGTAGSRLMRPVVYYRKTLRLLRKGGYECAHIHGDVAYLMLIFALAARRAGIPKVILHSHAAGIDGSARRLKAVLHGLCRNLITRHATDFAACSDVAATWMFPHLKPESVRMIYNGIELRRFAFNQEQRRRVREDLGLENAFVVGHVGRFAYQKNHEYLLEVFSAIRRRVSGARLLLVGEGVLFETIRERASKLGLDDEVLFYGASRNVGSLMMAMDLFILPSRFEGLPVVGVEAQAAGLPVLFSDSITRQAAITGQVWFLPAATDAVDQWADLAARIAAEPHNRTDAWHQVADKGFTIENTVRGFMELYGMGIISQGTRQEDAP